MASLKDFEAELVDKLFIPGMLGAQITAVEIDPSRMVYNILFEGQRAHDGFKINAKYCVTESMAMEGQIKDLAHALKDAIYCELAAYCACSCKQWTDPRTRKSFYIPCEAHLRNDPTIKA